MKLTITRSANSVCYYVSESFRKPNGVSSTRTIMKLGNEQYLREKLGEGVDIKEWCKEQVRIMTENQKAGKPSPVTVTLIPDEPYEKDEKREFNVGYFILKQQLNKLNFSKLCKEISDKQKFQYNFEQIFSDLICTRILEPTSKLSSFEYANEHFLKKPEYALSDVYRALDVIADNDEFIQSFLYQTSATSNADVKRNTDVLFYDCTNFFFESNDSGELRRYGKSKENRPNPIVQMGLFMDGNGIPLGYSIFPGNQNEQPSLKPLEQRIINDFNLSDKNMIICTDAGLASIANRRFNTSLKRDFITISPIRKMTSSLQDWVLNHGRSFNLNPILPDENKEIVLKELFNNGWRVVGDTVDDSYFSLDDIDENDPCNFNKIFYKERYIIDDKTKFEQRLIVTYSIKYKKFLENKRNNDIERAKKLINSHNSSKIEIKGNHDVRQYISTIHVDTDGIVIKDATCLYNLNENAIAEQAKYDGFYAVCTSLSKEEKTVSEIVSINKGRWEIEELFRIMKTEFKSRPVFVSTDKHIKAHFNTCFVALLVFRLLEHTILQHSKDHYTVKNIVKTLRDMKITKTKKYYTGSFTRTDLTDVIHEISGTRFDCDMLLPKTIEKYLKKFS